MRQLLIAKAALDLADLVGKVCSGYATLCGEVLAKGHAPHRRRRRAGGLPWTSAKDDAIAEFAVTYAAQTKADYKVFMKSLPKKKPPPGGRGFWIGKGLSCSSLVLVLRPRPRNPIAPNKLLGNLPRLRDPRTRDDSHPKNTRPPFPIARAPIFDTHLARRFTRLFSKAPTPSTGILRTNPPPPMPSSHLSRRRFLTQTAGVAAATVLGPNLLLRGQNTAGKRLNIAVIGALGEKARVDTEQGGAGSQYRGARGRG